MVTKSETRVEKNMHILSEKELALDLTQETAASTAAFSQNIRALLQNWRQGTVACKDRSKVTSRSNKKPWKQKGTGRARAGSPRSPLWRGGGVTFGPQPRVRTLKVAKAMRRSVMLDLFLNKLRSGSIMVMDWQSEGTTPKTAVAHKALTSAGLIDKKVLLFVRPHDEFTQISFANVSGVFQILFDQPNAYALATCDTWVIAKSDIELFKQMVESWI